MSTSQGGLIFDVSGSGAGVEVFQPLDIVAGQSALKDTPLVKDGDQSLALHISELKAGSKISFTIDVDDTLGGSEITVANSKIKGAVVSLGDYSATFSSSEVVLALPSSCTTS